MADGSIAIKVNADTKKAQSELSRLEKAMQKTAANIEKMSTEKSGIEKSMDAAGNAADVTREKIKQLNAELAAEKQRGASSMIGGTKTLETYESEAMQQQITSRLAEQQAKLKTQVAEAEKLDKQYWKVTENLSKQNALYEQQKQQVGEIRAQMAQTGGQALQKLRDGASETAAAFKSGFKNILKWGIGIRSVFLLVKKLKSGIAEGFQKYIEIDPETKANVDALKSSLEGLKVSWAAAFAPIVNAAIPYLQTLIGWLKTAAEYVSMFFAALTGASSYKRAISNNNALAKSYGGAGSAAKEAENQIMGFDEINKLNDNSSSGGGGGGGAGSAAAEFEDVELPDWAQKLEDFMEKFKINVKDVLFNWSNLNGEQIAKKAIAGLSALLGAGIGFMIGGVPGAIIGTLLGFTLGIAIDNVLFNNDGQLDREEIAGMLVLALGALAGGAIGFMIGGPGGALIGATIGLGVGLLIGELSFNHDGKLSKNEIRSAIIKTLTVLCGGVIGFVIGGPVGAAIGATIGLALVLATKSFDTSGVEKPFSEWFPLLREKISNGWNTVTELFHEKWNDLKSWWGGLSLGSFPFHLPHIQVDWQELSADSILARFLGFSAIPHLSVAWYARGGIVDGATLIGAGEAGKEAIIPLERNTEWIRKVAIELLDVMESRYQGVLNGIPAMAMGQVVPPRAVSGGAAFSESEEAISRILTGLQDAFRSTPIEIELTNRTYLDGRQIAQNTTRHQREISKATGK